MKHVHTGVCKCFPTFQKLINKWSKWGSWYRYKYSIMPQNSIYYLLISLTATASISQYGSFSLIKLPKSQYGERLVTILWARFYQTKIHVMVCNTSPIYKSNLPFSIKANIQFFPSLKSFRFFRLMFRDFTFYISLKGTKFQWTVDF